MEVSSGLPGSTGLMQGPKPREASCGVLGPLRIPPPQTQGWLWVCFEPTLQLSGNDKLKAKTISGTGPSSNLLEASQSVAYKKAWVALSKLVPAKWVSFGCTNARFSFGASYRNPLIRT